MIKPFRLLKKIIDNAIKEEKSIKRMGELAKLAADKIKKRTRLGKGVSKQGGKNEKLKPLAESTVKTRKSLKKNRKLSPKTTVKKSNLTQSGQMLDSIDGKGKKFGVGEVYFNENRVSDDVTNSQVASYVSKDRPFFNLSKSEINALRRDIQKRLKTKIEKAIKRAF